MRLVSFLPTIFLLLNAGIAQSSPSFLCPTLHSFLAPTPSRFTPSKWFLAGDQLADRVLKELPAYRTTRSSVWLEFQEDPRFRGIPTNQPSEALRAAANVYQADRSIVTDLAGWERHLVGMGNDRPYAFVTWENLGIRAINKLISRRVYPMGLIETDMKVDGETYTPPEFLGHDMTHARFIENILSWTWDFPTHGDFSRKFYLEFNYASITRRLSEDHKLLFDLAYFLYFHETYGGGNFVGSWGYYLSQIAASGRPTHQSLQESYRVFESSGLAIIFQNGTPRVTLQNPTDNIRRPLALLIARFLDRGDLWVNLPLEIKNQIRVEPNRANAILTTFIEEMFTVFFKPHYALAAEMLDLR